MASFRGPANGTVGVDAGGGGFGAAKLGTGVDPIGVGTDALPSRCPPASAINCARQPSPHAYLASPLMRTTCDTSSTTNRLLQASQTTPAVVSPRKLLPWQACEQKNENAPSRSSIW